MTRNRVIGKDGDLPWRLPDDQRFFRRTTLGKPIIMGRKTFEEIGRPLPKRRNIVLSRRGLDAEGVEVATTLEAALALARSDAPGEAFIIGGAEIYSLALPMTDRLYMTLIDAELDGDTWFPDFDTTNWHGGAAHRPRRRRTPRMALHDLCHGAYLTARKPRLSARR